MSDYATADSFGAVTTTVTMRDTATGVTYGLGFGPAGADGTPTVVWTPLSTWTRAKAIFGPTWATAKRLGLSWGQAKAIVSSGG